MATYTGSDKRLKYLFDHINDGGGHKIFYGTCNTSANARQKEVTVSVDQGFYLDTGVVVFVTFDNTNTYEADASNPVTLNVNSSGSNNIKYGSSSTPTGTNGTAFGRANYTNCYVFDGTYWVWQGSSADNNTTYQNREEAQGGTQTSLVTTGDKYTWNKKVSDNPTFTEASTRANIASGESFTTILGKIKKYFTDLKTVAFSGSYNDLSNKPTIPTVPDIVDNLTTQDATKTLSAKQGYVLNQNKVDKVASKIKTDTSGQFDTVTGGKLLSCILAFTLKQSGSGTPSPDNVRPITGHTSGEVVNEGKNRLPNIANNTICGLTLTQNNDGSVRIKGTPTTNDIQFFIDYFNLASGTYICSTGLDSVPSSGQVQIRVGKGSGGSTLIGHADKSNTLSFTLAETTTVRCSYRIQNLSGTAIDVTYHGMVRVSTESSEYVPYQPKQDITIQFGDTYYGGTFDFVSGVLTITHAIYVYDGSSDEGWVYQNSVDGKSLYRANSIQLPLSDYTTDYTTNMSLPNSASSNSGDIGSYIYNKTIRYRVPSTFTDVSAWKTFLASNNMQVVYPLATPQTIQLSPSQINSLVGQNNLSAPLDGQSIQSAQYREVLSWDDVEEKYQYEEVQLTDSNFHARVRRFGRVVNIDFPIPLYPMGTAEDSWISLGILPERFYHKYPNPTVEVSIYATIATFVDDSNDIVPVLVRINQYSGEVLGYFKAENYVQPFGTITYILDHD